MLNTAKCWFNQQLKQQLFLLEIKKSSQMSHLRQKSLGFDAKKISVQKIKTETLMCPS